MGITANIDISAEQRRLVLELIKTHLPNTRVWAFGSRVKWTTRANSDLDLVAFSTPQQDPQISALKEAFEESNLPFRVDLLVWDKLPENFQRNIQECYVVLVEANEVEKGLVINSDVILSEYGPVSKSLSASKLSELCIEKIGVQTGPFGSQLHNEDYVIAGTPIITVEHLGENRISHANTPFVSDEDKARLSRYHLAPGDIVFSRVGSVDRRALVREEEDGWLFSGRCLRVRVDKEKINPVYLSYFFGLEGFKNYIRSIAVGATMPSINTKILSDVPIYYPDLDKQKSIAETLYSIDEKIELNRQTSQTLEQIAQAIFKSWFVDFEPVKAKIAALNSLSPGERAGVRGQELAEQAAICAICGKTPEQLAQLDPQTLQQLKTTAALFPDALVDSELGEIPEGWKLGPLSDIAVFANGRIDVSKLSLENYISTENMLEDKKGVSTASSLPNVKSVPNFNIGQILISNIRPYFKKIWLARFEGGRSNDVLGLEPKDSNCVEFLYNLLYQDEFFNFMMSTSKGAKMPRGDKSAIMGWICIQPSLEIKTAYAKNVENFYKSIDSATRENEYLESLRDSLLPKLLSGEINLSNANEAA